VYDSEFRVYNLQFIVQGLLRVRIGSIGWTMAVTWVIHNICLSQFASSAAFSISVSVVLSFVSYTRQVVTRGALDAGD
jgi:hypothetical protein